MKMEKERDRRKRCKRYNEEELKTNGKEERKKQKTHLGQAIDGIGQHVRQILVVVLGGGVVVHFVRVFRVFFFLFTLKPTP